CRLQSADALECCRKLARAKAETVHAGVDFDPEQEALRTAALLEQLYLQHVVDDEVESVSCRFQQMLRSEDAFEQYDRLRDSGGPECEPLFQPRHPERIGLCERERRWHEPMPVSVGL